MATGPMGLIRRLLDGVIGLVPDGGVGGESSAPDIDGRRDMDTEYRQSVLRAKSQMSPDGKGTTSYEHVDRAAKRD
jgi:hypothetical protein